MPRPLRVLFAIGSLAAGGSERQLLNILRHIDRERIAPQLYLLDRAGEFLADVPDDVRITAFSDQPQTSRLYFPGRIRRQQIAQLTQTLRQQQVDILYDRTFLMPLITGPACQPAGVPRVSTIVADPRVDLEHNVQRFRWLKRRLLTQAYQSAERVISVSQELGQLAAEFYNIAPTRLRTIYNGFDFETIHKLANEPCPELDDQHFHIVSIGRLQEQKAVDLLLHAVQLMGTESLPKPLRVWIIGEGPDAARLQSVAQQLKLQEAVQFVGYQANPYRWLRRAQLFVLTSRSEGLPNVLVEALACEVPVISTNCPFGPAEILNDPAIGSLVPVDDPAALAAAIRSVMQRAETIPIQTRRARESVERRFGLQQCVSQLTDLLADVLHP